MVSGKVVIGDLCGICRGVAHTDRTTGFVIDDRVAGDDKIGSGIEVAFFAIRDNGVVRRIWTLLDDVSLDRGIAAFRKIDRVAGCTVEIVDARVCDCVVVGAAFDFVTVLDVVKVAVVDGQTSNAPDIEPVCLTEGES